MNTPAEVGRLGGLLRQGGVVHGARRDRVQRQVELVVPPELKASPRQLVVPRLRRRVALPQQIPRCTS